MLECKILRPNQRLQSGYITLHPQRSAAAFLPPQFTCTQMELMMEQKTKAEGSLAIDHIHMNTFPSKMLLL